MLISLLTLAEYLFTWDVGIDQLWVREQAGTAVTLYPGRIAPNTVVAFLLIGSGLLLLDLRTQGCRITQYLALGAGLIGLLGLLGYLYQTRLFIVVAPFTPMAFHTALTVFVLSIGILSARPGCGMMITILGDGPGGRNLRLLWPTVLLLTTVFGALALLGLRREHYDAPLSMALAMIAVIVAFSVILFRFSTSLEQADQQREAAAREARQLNAELEQRVRERTVELENAVKELEAFSYTVAHDLRSPLRGMNGFSRYLLANYQDRLDERGRDYLARISKAAERLGRLIDDLLNLARISRIPLKVEEVNLSTLAREAIEELRRREPERRVTVEIVPGLTVSGDRGMLRTALGHLLDNAWKFTGKRDDARITVGSIDQAGERVYYVRDNGAGFDINYMNKLYQPFQRLHTEEEFTGTGMGLALAQRIIQRHGGRIWAESSEGEGATFYFTVG